MLRHDVTVTIGLLDGAGEEFGQGLYERTDQIHHGEAWHLAHRDRRQEELKSPDDVCRAIGG